MLIRRFIASITIVFFILFASCSGEKDSNLWLFGIAAGSDAVGEQTTTENTENTNGDTTDPQEGTTGDDSTETVTGDLSEDDVEVTGEDEPENSEEAFDFATSREVDLTVNVKDSNGVVPGVIVKVIGNASSSETTLFQGKTGESGNVAGLFSVDETESSVTIRVIFGDSVYEKVVSVEGIAAITRNFTVEGAVDTTSEIVADTDSDGIPDTEDAYPEDASAAAIVTTPSIGLATVAFEDLYPKKGDADFNDFVASVHMEEDLNADGQVVRVRGTYQLIARGAGYDHDLMLNIPGNHAATVVVERYTEDQNYLEQDTFSDTSAIKLINSSKRSISGKNTRHNEAYKAGNIAKLSIEFDSPVSKSELGKAPYDLYLYIRSTKREVHFPGRYKKADGSDLYLDEDGFPWAIMIPQEWNWPLESRRIGDFHASSPGCYASFDEWYKSEGQTNKDWYDTYEEGCVFPYTESISNGSGLSGYLIGSGVTTPVVIFTVLAGAVGLVFATLLARKKA